MLGHIPLGGSTVVADLEAGIGTLTRLPEGTVDLALIVVEATPKSIEVGQRAAEVAVDRHVGRLIVVANRVRSEEDRTIIDAAFPGREVIEVPEDPAIVQADREGVAPLDHDPSSPAVRALAEVAQAVRARC